MTVATARSIPVRARQVGSWQSSNRSTKPAEGVLQESFVPLRGPSRLLKALRTLSGTGSATPPAQKDHEVYNDLPEDFNFFSMQHYSGGVTVVCWLVGGENRARFWRLRSPACPICDIR